MAAIAAGTLWDGMTIAAQKALSAVYRTGQRFGAQYLINILLGKDDARMRRFGHYRIKTFGLGRELSAKQWRSVFRQLIALGLLAASLLLLQAGPLSAQTDNDDCFACHDQTGTYSKAPPSAGRPPATVDLQAVAQSVGENGGVPTRKACLFCHQNAGGGDNVKHGDLSSALVATTREYDVHMGTDGGDLVCATCHSVHPEEFGVRANGPVELIWDEGATPLDFGDNSNICGQCHQSRRAEPATASEAGATEFEITSVHYGPHHGPQGDMLKGTGGYEWEAEGDSVTLTFIPHLLFTENACVDCHLAEAPEDVVLDAEVERHNVEMVVTGTAVPVGSLKHVCLLARHLFDCIHTHQSDPVLCLGRQRVHPRPGVVFADQPQHPARLPFPCSELPAYAHHRAGDDSGGGDDVGNGCPIVFALLFVRRG